MDTKDIYRCHVSGRFHDPLAVHRKLLLQSRGEINTWLRDQRGADELASLAAEDKLVPVIRAAFGLTPVDPANGSGTTDSNALRTLDFFLRWLEEKKVRGQSSQTVSPCADCPQP